MEELIEKLQKKSKTEIISIIENFLMSGEVPTKVFEKYITAEDYTPQEQIIVDKLQDKKALTRDELEYIKERLSKRANTTIRTILSGSGHKFDAFLVKAKIDTYFTISWQHYPRKVGKAEGEKAFTKLVSEQKLGVLNQYCEFVIKKIDKYAEQCQDNDTEEQFIMHFSTFCNSKRYL